VLLTYFISEHELGCIYTEAMCVALTPYVEEYTKNYFV
jgi:hypothetical protein